MQDKHETIGQAEHFDKTVARYERQGFCRPCAGQAAYGHQVGFARVRPVGDECRGLDVPSNSGRRAQAWANGAQISDLRGK